MTPPSSAPDQTAFWPSSCLLVLHLWEGTRESLKFQFSQSCQLCLLPQSHEPPLLEGLFQFKENCKRTVEYIGNYIPCAVSPYLLFENVIHVHNVFWSSLSFITSASIALPFPHHCSFSTLCDLPHTPFSTPCCHMCMGIVPSARALVASQFLSVRRKLTHFPSIHQYPWYSLLIMVSSTESQLRLLSICWVIDFFLFLYWRLAANTISIIFTLLSLGPVVAVWFECFQTIINLFKKLIMYS